MKQIVITFGELPPRHMRVDSVWEYFCIGAALAWSTMAEHLKSRRNRLATRRDGWRTRLSAVNARLKGWPAGPRFALAPDILAILSVCVLQTIHGPELFGPAGWLALAAFTMAGCLMVLLFSEKARRNIWPGYWR